MRPFYLIPPIFNGLFFAVLTFFIFSNKAHAAADITTTHFKTEKTKSNKHFLKKQKRIKKWQEKLTKKRKPYFDFDYNILLAIALGLIGVAIIIALLGSLFSLLFLVVAGLLLLIAISNDAHWVAWVALVFSVLLFYPIYFSLREYD